MASTGKQSRVLLKEMHRPDDDAPPPQVGDSIVLVYGKPPRLTLLARVAEVLPATDREEGTLVVEFFNQ